MSQPALLLEEAISHRLASLFQSDSLFLATVKPGQWASHPVYQSSVKAKAETPKKNSQWGSSKRLQKSIL
jgi:hypothetical protein